MAGPFSIDATSMEAPATAFARYVRASPTGTGTATTCTGHQVPMKPAGGERSWPPT